MAHFKTQKNKLPKKQQGAALLLFVLLLIVGASTLLVSKLNKAATQYYRDDVTMKALVKAKEALIGYAVSYPDNPTTTNINAGPGYLPCPDVSDPPNGSPTPCSPNTVGRLPWEFIGLDEIRDSSGEHLWYVVSDDFRNNPIKHFPLNSETAGGLTIDGTSDIVAIILAPGFSFEGQNRPSNVASDYLEGDNRDGDADFVSSSSSSNFNDQVLVITRQELMAAVEKRVMGEVAIQLNEYRRLYGNGGVYPFLAPFSSPRTSSYNSDQTGATTQGLIPYHEVDETFSTSFEISLNIKNAIFSPTPVLNPPHGQTNYWSDRTTLSSLTPFSIEYGQGECLWTQADVANCEGTLSESQFYLFGQADSSVSEDVIDPDQAFESLGVERGDIVYNLSNSVTISELQYLRYGANTSTSLNEIIDVTQDFSVAIERVNIDDKIKNVTQNWIGSIASVGANQLTIKETINTFSEGEQFVIIDQDLDIDGEEVIKRSGVAYTGSHDQTLITADLLENFTSERPKIDPNDILIYDLQNNENDKEAFIITSVQPHSLALVSLDDSKNSINGLFKIYNRQLSSSNRGIVSEVSSETEISITNMPTSLNTGDFYLVDVATDQVGGEVMSLSNDGSLVINLQLAGTPEVETGDSMIILNGAGELKASGYLTSIGSYTLNPIFSTAIVEQFSDLNGSDYTFDAGDTFLIRMDFVRTRTVNEVDFKYEGNTRLESIAGEKVRHVDAEIDTADLFSSITDHNANGDVITNASISIDENTTGTFSTSNIHVDYENLDGVAKAGSNTTTLIDTNIKFPEWNVNVGDWVENFTNSTKGKVKSIDESKIVIASIGSPKFTIDVGDEYKIYHEFPKWFFHNNWQQLMLVAESEQHFPGQSGNCADSAVCLKINGSDNSGTTRQAPNNDDKKALVIAAGQELSVLLQDRDNGLISDYYEGDNNNEDTTFDLGSFDPTLDVFNDQIKRVAPCPPPNEIDNCY